MKITTNVIEPVEGKTDSFFGDRSVVMTRKQLKTIRNNPLIGGLYISDIGFYPHARTHYRKRKAGINENILIYCIDGAGSIHIGTNVYELQANHYFVIPAHEAHAYWASERFPWSIYWIHFGGERSFLFNEFFGKVTPIEQSSKSRIDDRINLFNELLRALESGFSIQNMNYANLCLNSLLASFFFVDTFRAVKGQKSSDPVDQVILLMQKTINKNLKISDLSTHVNLSESHLSKIFRNKTGSSPLDYFINLKMQEAIRLLTNQSLKIKEVAYRLGYNDPYYFTRIFTKHIGSSPASFVKVSKRKSNR
ncbi:AraC family transcriptional regulator [uncultured Sunxiuqinia sp.]|uniref:helix-turn-helix domain-containing protein n=1 Tax=uncultured Sunxiuqinia sp. TaxID=1573825 RepID=UPI0030DB7148